MNSRILPSLLSVCFIGTLISDAKPRDPRGAPVVGEHPISSHLFAYNDSGSLNTSTGYLTSYKSNELIPAKVGEPVDTDAILEVVAPEPEINVSEEAGKAGDPVEIAPDQIDDSVGLADQDEAFKILRFELARIFASFADDKLDSLKTYRFEDPFSQTVYNRMREFVRENRKDDLLKEISEKANLIADLESQVEDLKGEYGADVVASLNLQLKNLKDQLESIKADDNSLISVVELNQLLSDYEISPLNTTNPTFEVVQLLVTSTQLDKDRKLAEIEHYRALHELETLREEAELAAKRLESYIAEVATLEAERDGKSDLAAVLTEDLRVARNDLGTLKIKFDALRAKYDTEISRRDAQIETYRSQMVDRLKHVEELTLALSALAERPDSGVLLESSDLGKIASAYDQGKLRMLIRNVLQSIHNYSYSSSPNYASVENVIAPQFLEKVKATFDSLRPHLIEHLVVQTFKLQEITFFSGEGEITASCKGIFTVITDNSIVNQYEYSATVTLIPTKHNTFNPTGFVISNIVEAPPVLIKQNQLSSLTD